MRRRVGRELQEVSGQGVVVFFRLRRLHPRARRADVRSRADVQRPVKGRFTDLSTAM